MPRIFYYAPNLTVHLDEVLLGTGGLDYRIYLSELSKLKDVPLMLEHLKTKEEYDQAASNVKEDRQPLSG